MPRNEVVVHPGNNGWSMRQLANRAAAVYVADPQGWTNLYNSAIRNGSNYISDRVGYYQGQSDERDYSTARRKISNRSPQSEARPSSSSPKYFKARSSYKSYNNLKKYGYYKKKKIWRK
jgi:hypothetical protein